MSSMTGKRSIEKTYKKVKLQERRSDFAYWQSQPPEKRIAELERIRMEYHGWTEETRPRIQKVVTIIKRK